MQIRMLCTRTLTVILLPDSLHGILPRRLRCAADRHLRPVRPAGSTHRRLPRSAHRLAVGRGSWHVARGPRHSLGGLAC